MYSGNEILAIAERIMDYYETTALEEMRTGSELTEAYYRALRDNPGCDMRDVLTKEVGRKLEYNCVCIEKYTDKYMGIRIICNDEDLMDEYCEDGVVFVAIRNRPAQIIAHGDWEDLLCDLYPDC